MKQFRVLGGVVRSKATICRRKRKKTFSFLFLALAIRVLYDSIVQLVHTLLHHLGDGINNIYENQYDQ